jgi:hypothetical protein
MALVVAPRLGGKGPVDYQANNHLRIPTGPRTGSVVVRHKSGFPARILFGAIRVGEVREPPPTCTLI